MNGNGKPQNLLPDLEALSAAWMSALAPFGIGGGPAELAARLLDPRQWLGVGGAAVEQPFEAILGLPRLADIPAYDRKLLALMQDWMTVAQRSSAFHALVAQIWLHAYQTFQADLQRAAAEGKSVGSGRELLERWTATANATLLKAQRDDDFLAAQRRLLEAVLASRTREREIVEAQAEALGLPTRTEMDDVHRTLQEVKRELRALKRQLAAEAAAKEDAPRRQAAPARAAARDA
ncbi:MAG TPA: poly(R)-hydroxyalkanoic acid synthase subunit PhaE [Geminicoccaceae bacterium]|nr:poly(R)-hydroxyalkanoic acid synthase subunit PhaE [Geminicoccaceae bacterium]